MSGGSVKLPMVIRTPAGCGTREGAHHSQSLEAWFMHTPGLKVVMPSTPYDAKGLFKAAIRDDGPVVFIQHRLLHPTTQEVPDGDWTVPLGVADVKREGKDLTVVAYSYGLHKAMQAAEALNNEISVEIVDPRTLTPLDVDTIEASARKTGRLLVMHEAPERSGAGAEIVKQVVARGVNYFKAAPRVLGVVDVPMPYSAPLEDACIPQVWDIVRVAREMMAE
jgi:pyruvate/2-oxoglutarate/acetoin dehydrogenase E1 component